MVKGLGVGKVGIGNGGYFRIWSVCSRRQSEEKHGKRPEKVVIYKVVRGRKEGRRERIREEDSERGGENE